MPSTPPQSNSLLHMLNPYSSMARSSHPPPQPADSPSTLLLRELAGEDGSDDEDPRANGVDNDEDEAQRDRLSPTPTPTARRPTHVLEDEDEDEPPASIMYGDSPPRSGQPSRSSTSAAGTSARRSIERARPVRQTSGDKTPQTPRSPNPALSSSVLRHPSTHASKSSAIPMGRVSSQSGPSTMPRPTSPGPFRNTHGPSSSSASEAGQHSQSTSPGPSTISIYASGLEGTALEETEPSSSRDPSTSPEKPKAPTFREVPGYRPAPPLRTASRGADGRLVNGSGQTWQGYLDPPTSKGKGKAKEKTKSGKKYLAVPSGEQEEEEEHDMEDTSRRDRMKGYGGGRILPRSGLNEYERALWKWVNVDDLDGFLQEVYDYYKGKGVYCIALARVLNLLTTFFVIAFSTFLLQCIDYHKLFHIHGSGSPGRLDDVLVPQCLTHGSVPHMLFIIAVSVFYVFQLVSFALSLPRLLEIYRFYTYLLGIPDADIQTLPWPEIVRLIGEIRKHNPVTSLSNGQADALADMIGADVKGDIKKLDAHDVANRILRQENYLIALFNKDLLDLRVRLPVPHQYVHLVPISLLAAPAGTALPSTHADRPQRQYLSFGANTLTKALEWNLRFCLLGYLFDSQGQVRREFVREKRRKDLVEGLKRRFVFMGILNAIFAPFIIVYLLIYSFFRYFEEYRNHPSSIGSRQYTPYAQWKFREFNELPHLFETRLAQSYPIAKGYVDQFPNERSKLVMRFVAFIVGAPSAVLLVLTLLDPDLFLHFEITSHRTVLFYLGVFGSVLAIARGMIPAENLVFDPEQSLREVVRWTHYLPGEWRGKLHSRMVHAEFSSLFALKISVFFTELLSVLLTPFILWFSLPPCAGAIIDFFREFTVHVDGVGYVCSFAVFDFRRHGAMKPPEPGAPISPTTALSPQGSAKPGAAATVTSPTSRGFGRGRDWRANENKMEKSFLHFKATHPDWQPSDPSSSVFLDRLVGMHQAALRHPGGPSAMSPPAPYDNGAIGTGARGLGLALGGDAVLRERSRSYDRAWAKSSHLLKPKLEPMRENEPERMGESEEVPGEDGEVWNKRIRDMDEDEDDEEGFLRDVGMMGLLQQVMRR